MTLACVSPPPGSGPESAAAAVPEHLLLDKGGLVHTTSRTFAIDDQAEAQELVVWARAWIAAHPGELIQARAEKEASAEDVRTLIRLLDSDGVGAYHLRKGRTLR